MRHEIPVLSAAAVAAVTLLACGGGSGQSGGGSSGGSCAKPTIVASEASNYRFTSTLMFPPITVKANAALTFDWGDVTHDFIGHPLDNKKDLNMVLLMLWNLSVTDLQTKLNADQLAMSDLAVLPLSLPTDGNTTTAGLYSLTLNGNPVTMEQLAPYFDPATYPPANHIYTMMVATGKQLGQGTRMIQAFQLDPASTNTVIKMNNESTHLTYTANLHSMAATAIPAGSAAVKLDWGKMMTNALGNPFIATNVTDAMVGHYTQTPAELEAQFLDLEQNAKELYRASIDSGTVLDFSTLKTSTGQSFTGIDSTGTWIVALQCGSCRNPAPWYLTVLKPCS